MRNIICTLFLALIVVNLTALAQSSSIVIHRINYSPDGNFIVGYGSVYDDPDHRGILRVWDVQSLAMVFETRSQFLFPDVSWSLDSTQLIAIDFDYIRVWNIALPDTAPGTLITEFRPISDPDIPFSIALSPNGQQLAIVSGVSQARIEIWDTDTYTYLDSTRTGDQSLDLEWNPTQPVIASVGFEDRPILAISTLTTGWAQYSLCEACLPQSASSVAWNSDGSKIAIGFIDGTVHIVDFSTNQPVITLDDSGIVTDVIWSFDDQYIATPLGIWDAETGQPLKIFEGGRAIDLHPSQHEFATFDNDTQQFVFTDISDIIALPILSPISDIRED